MRFLVPTIMAAILLIGVVLPSCYPTYGLTTTDYRTVVTVYDTAADFNALRTYFLVDSVFHILEPGGRDTITRDYDEAILEKIDANFKTYGWSRITDTTGSNIPATLVRVSVTGSVTSGTYYNWWYPWYGGGWWGYPGYGWGWGGYYPPTYWGTYSYTTGSLIVQMDNITVPANPTDSLQLTPLWLAASSGLLTNSKNENASIINYEIRQMFTQSPYLALTPQQ